MKRHSNPAPSSRRPNAALRVAVCHPHDRRVHPVEIHLSERMLRHLQQVAKENLTTVPQLIADLLDRKYGDAALASAPHNDKQRAILEELGLDHLIREGESPRAAEGGK